MEELPVSTSRQMAFGFFVLLATNSLIVWISNLLFPNLVVLGTMNLSYWWAVFLSMGTLALIGTLSVPLMEYVQEKLCRPLSMMEWMLGYFTVNFVGLWVISRFSEQFGLGIAAWWVALTLAIVLDFVQGLGMMLVYPKPSREEVTIIEVEEEIE